MGKAVCPVCGKGYGAGHWSVVDCPQIKSEVKVERIPQSALLPESGTVPPPTSTVPKTTRTVRQDEGTVPKNRRWEQTHSDSYRAWRKEYDRKRRA